MQWMVSVRAYWLALMLRATTTAWLRLETVFGAFRADAWIAFPWARLVDLPLLGQPNDRLALAGVNRVTSAQGLQSLRT